MVINVRIEMTPEQVEAWTAEEALSADLENAKQIKADVASYARTTLQGSTLGEYATITAK